MDRRTGDMMYLLNVNGKEISAQTDQKLLVFLREVCNCTSVKDGCSEGACGTCTVLIDGKPTKACIPLISKLEGKKILTVEGLTAEEAKLYVYAFGEAGAVQCGFCIPGMVMCTKALLDENKNPTREEIAFALRNNICRCTGYKKIMDAVQIAAKLLREGRGVPEKKNTYKIGENVHRLDVEEKVLGTGVYVDDMKIDGMVYASALRSAYPRALVKEINKEKAEALEGVIRIITAADIPGDIKVGHIKQDWDTLIPVGEITRYLGDAICLVAAETKEIVEEAKNLVEVIYEELESMRSPAEAMREGAPDIHPGGNVLAEEHLVRGDAKTAIESSEYVIHETFTTPFTEHAFLEPECAVALPYEDGVLIYSSDQGVYATRQECAEMLALAPEKVRVINQLVGGGFGGKEDMSVQHHAALCAYLTGKTVKVKLTRAESILVHPKRHPMELSFTLACNKDGILTGLHAKIISDTGAYASLGGPVLQRACTHAAGPYNYQNIIIDGKAIYTNNPPAGAFRGFGVTQSCFATECCINRLAEMVGISPWEIRYRNAIRPGQELPNGQIADASTGLAETLDAVKEIYENGSKNGRHAGIACAMKNAGVGVGIPDYGRCILGIKDKKIHIRSGASCIGQGLGTVLVQIVCETLSVDHDAVIYDRSNSIDAPDSGTTSGSRQTLITGEAARRACISLAEDLKEHTLEELEGKEFYGEYLAKTDKMGSDIKNPLSHVAYGYATQVVILNEEGKIEQVAAAHDVGKAINPRSVEGQIEGGVVMSLGYALTEKYPITDCKPMAKYGTLGLLRANQVPDVKSIIVEKEGIHAAYGAIGIGEITSIPTAPAVQGAYYAYDHNFRTSLPLPGTPYSK